jgi:hypothetical protein
MLGKRSYKNSMSKGRSYCEDDEDEDKKLKRLL